MGITDLIPESISQKVTLWEACEFASPLRMELEKHFKAFAENNDFSIQELFKVSFLDNCRLNLYFLPASRSYYDYGSFATIVGVNLDEDEIKRMTLSVLKGEKTHGIMPVKALYGEKVNSNEQNIEINTKDVYKVTILKM